MPCWQLLLPSPRGFARRKIVKAILVLGKLLRNPVTHRHTFKVLASQLIDEAVQEFDHSPPPLSLLQAAILLAHGQLTQGVRGKAWRSLGTCVRIAYELKSSPSRFWVRE